MRGRRLAIGVLVAGLWPASGCRDEEPAATGAAVGFPLYLTLPGATVATGRILKIDAPDRSGQYAIATFLADLDFPKGIAVGRDGNVYFTTQDASGQGSIMHLPAAGGGATELVGDLISPAALAFDSFDNLHVLESQSGRVYRITDGAPALLAENLSQPLAMALDSLDRLYIAEAGARRVARLAPNGERDRATAAEIAQPVAVAVDSGGLVLILDNNGGQGDGRLLYLHQSSDEPKVAVDGLINALALGVDDIGAAYVAEGSPSNRLLKLPADGGRLFVGPLPDNAHGMAMTPRL